MRYRILGQLEVHDGEQLVPLAQGRQRLLLAVLLLHAGESVSSDRLLDALWGEVPPPTASRSLHNLISGLRRALGNGALVTEGHGYVLRVPDDELDARRFESLIEAGQGALDEGDAAGASALLAKGLALWRGPPLSEFDLTSSERAELDRLGGLRDRAQEQRIDAELALGHHAEVVGELEAMIAEHPLHEHRRGQLMVALYRSGRQADALAVYRQTRTLLHDELGLEPGAELRRLEAAILAHDPGLDPAPARARERATPDRGAAEPPAPGATKPPTRPTLIRARRGAVLIAAGGALLLAAAIAAAAAILTGASAKAVQVAPNSVAAIDTSSDRVTGAVAVGARPGAIASGSGSLWVANVDDETISRVDPERLRTTRTLPVGGAPTGVAASTDAIWVATAKANASAVFVKRVDPAFDAVGRAVRLGNVVPGGPGEVAARGHTVWAAPSSGALTRLDPETGRPRRRVEPNAGPTGVDVGDGAVWVTDTEADNVTRVDPSGLKTPIAVGDGPSGIAVGEGGVWVADSLDNAIVHIDPRQGAVTTTIAAGDAPTGVAVGAGSVWVANSGDGTVTRIDPRRDKVLATIAVGGSPQAITVVNGRAWVTVDSKPVTSADRSPDGGTLRVDSGYPLVALDPAVALYTPQWQVLDATCAQLLNYPDRSGPAPARPTPEVAQALPVVAADGRTYRFTIRPGFRFSPPSNEPVTAQTFKDTIERSLNPRMKGPLAGAFADIAGARAYMAGTAPHISGVVARGAELTIHLVTPEPDFLSRMAHPIFCAVPSNTPIDPDGVRVIPSAGPYHIVSFTPGQGAVLARNPNYRGGRPQRFERIKVSPKVSSTRAVADVVAGRSDETMLVGLLGSPPTALRALASRLSIRYGPGSREAADGQQRYFTGPMLETDLLALNTHRPLFAHARVRRAVNYAIDRRALARLGSEFVPLPDTVTDQYIPPGMPGFRHARIYPSTPNPAKAQALFHGARRSAVLYTCDASSCTDAAQIIKNDLAAIGLRVVVKTFGWQVLYQREARPGEPYDLATYGYGADYPDPSSMLLPLLQTPSNLPTFDDPTYRRRLAATNRLTGSRRYLAYGKLDVDLARHAAPLVAIGNETSHDFFSARIGCQRYGLNGIDLAALCIRPKP